MLPWEELVAICKKEGIWSVVDGAHSIGQHPVDLSKTLPDFWVSVSSYIYTFQFPDPLRIFGRIVINGSSPSVVRPFYMFLKGANFELE